MEMIIENVEGMIVGEKRGRARKAELDDQRSKVDKMFEGIEECDLEVYSTMPWKRWRKGLSDKDASALNVWRGGAVRTPTRVFFRGTPLDDVYTHCRECGEERGSATHLFKECPKFGDLRAELARTHRFSLDWWSRQPRCTAKSGWVTYSAAPSAEGRTQCAIAACKLGIAIVNAGHFEGPNYSLVSRPPLRYQEGWDPPHQ